MDTEREKEWKMHKYGESVKKNKQKKEVKTQRSSELMDGFLPRLGQSALKDQGNMGNTLRANVTEKLADIWLATHLRKKHREKSENDCSVIKKKKKKVLCDELCLMPAASLQSTTCSSILSAF